MRVSKSKEIFGRMGLAVRKNEEKEIVDHDGNTESMLEAILSVLGLDLKAVR